MRYAFIQDNQHIWPVRRLCSTLAVHHSGYYAWLKHTMSRTATVHRADQAILARIRWNLRLSQDSL